MTTRPTVEIRLADTEDAASLALLGSATFLETYADKVAGPDIVSHCMQRHAIAVYLQWLADPLTHIWIAELPTNTAIGYLVLTPATLPADDPHPLDLEIQRIYVLSRFHRTGTGHRLIQAAVEAAQQARARRIVLGVLQKNERAIAFYARQGFRQTGTRMFKVGQAIFDDFIFGRDL